MRDTHFDFRTLTATHLSTCARRLLLCAGVAASALWLVACACGGGGSGRSQCDPLLAENCVCTVPGATDACDPDTDFPCACSIGTGSPANNDSDGNNGGDNGGPDRPGNNDNNGQTNNGEPSGASIRLSLRYGAEAGRQFQEVAPWATAVLPAYRTRDADSPLVVMLCETDDPDCSAPVMSRPVKSTETDGAPMQFVFGPTLTVNNLPAGDYLFTVFMDSNTSRALGHGVEDALGTPGPWGGLVSETDLLLSEPAAPGVNPPPIAVPVQLRPGAQFDLGARTLGHFYESNLSPAYRPAAGRVIAATPTGVYIVDTDTRDTAFSPIAADELICGMIDAPGDAAWLLLDDVEGAGYALEIDTRDGQPTGARVEFPGVGQPCRGTFHQADGVSYLLVVDAAGGRGPDATGGAAVWTARLVPGLAQARSTTSVEVPVFAEGVNDIAAVGNTVFLTITPNRTVPPADRGHHLVVSAQLDRNAALTVGSYVRTTEAGDRGVDPLGRQPINDESAAQWAGLIVGRFHDGRDLLFVGGFSEVSVLEIPSLREVARVSGHYYGSNFTGFALDPTGETLWAIPQSKSAYHFEFEKGPGGDRQSFNRLMALPIDLSRGAQPAADGSYSAGDIDGYAGPTLSGNLTPGDDPGVDLGYGYYVAHQVLWAPDTAGATFGSSSFPVGHTAVATERHLWLRGSGTLGEAGPSGLGKGGDLAVFDLETRRALLHPSDDDPYYGVWSGGVYGQPTFGFRLDSADAETTTVGLIYEPTSD